MRRLDSPVEEGQMDSKRYRRHDRARIKGVYDSRPRQRRGVHTTGRQRRAGRKPGRRY